MANVENTPENMENCFCPSCPSYNDCARNKVEGLFCALDIGKSECPFQMNGCICNTCSVYQENDLKTGYYCIHGSAEETDEKFG